MKSASSSHPRSRPSASASGSQHNSHKQERMVGGMSHRRYPKPVKLGPRTTVWRAEDIAAFIKNLGRQGENHE